MQAEAAVVSHMYFAVGLCVLEPFLQGRPSVSGGVLRQLCLDAQIWLVDDPEIPPEKSAGARIGAPTANHRRPDRQPP